MSSRIIFFILLLCLGSCERLKPKAPAGRAVVVPEIIDEPSVTPVATEILPALDPAIPELTINKSASVSVLGYHEFVKGKPTNPMQLNIQRFREQMQSLKDARVTVISMSHFLAWRRGEKDIPDPSILITMDDGWKSVHTLALPVLKEFDYPFTIFLYKKFINFGGKSLNMMELKEIMATKGEIGCHSVSHPYKAKISSMYRQSPEQGDAFLRMEMKDSRQFLEDLLQVKVPTYAYPGGYFSPREEEIGKEAGYEAMFTVNPARVTWDTPFTAIGRFIILGTEANDANFKRAISTRGTSEGGLVKQLIAREGEDESIVSTKPANGATVASRNPVIEVNVTKLDGIDPTSITVRLAGFGLIPSTYNEQEKIIRAPVRETLRTGECQVFVQFKRKSELKPDMVTWSFHIDLTAYFLPEVPDKLEKAVPVAEEILQQNAEKSGLETPAAR